MAPTSSPSSRSSRVPSLAKYDVVDELGHGGMATVYRAHDRRLGRDVAVKVLHPHLRDSREIAHRFAVEARAVAKLRHPNIVEVYDVSSEDDDEQYLVVELLRGLTLRKILQRYGPLPPEVAAAIGVELASALAHAHAQGVVHRDVKPENVIVEHPSFAASTAPSSRSAVDVTPAPTSGRAVTEAPTSGPSSEDPRGPVRVKLTDFGIAKLLDAQGVTSTGQVLGSPAHMAPEQIEGGEVDERADVFGLGVLLYECMVGHLPFEGANPAQVLRRRSASARRSARCGAISSTARSRAIARGASATSCACATPWPKSSGGSASPSTRPSCAASSTTRRRGSASTRRSSWPGSKSSAPRLARSATSTGRPRPTTARSPILLRIPSSSASSRR